MELRQSRATHLILQLVDLGHHGAVLGGDPLVAIGALLDQRVVIDASASAHRQCQRLLAARAALVLAPHVQRVLDDVDLQKDDTVRRGAASQPCGGPQPRAD